uniref:DUF2804 family protein n=1 Tax=Streptomyces atratus TaxID=1893 RepID=UPI0038CF9D30
MGPVTGGVRACPAPSRRAGPGLRAWPQVDLFATLPAGHETLSVVVPWSERRFQYTSKHTARPASGTVRIGDRVLEFGEDA